ncbi:hypothetical protein GCM10020001_019020 [Nonomuraea salmonea]
MIDRHAARADDGEQQAGRAEEDELVQADGVERGRDQEDGQRLGEEDQPRDGDREPGDEQRAADELGEHGDRGPGARGGGALLQELRPGDLQAVFELGPAVGEEDPAHA